MFSEIQDRPRFIKEEAKELESRAEDFLDELDEMVDYAITNAAGPEDINAAFKYLSEVALAIIGAFEEPVKKLKTAI